MPLFTNCEQCGSEIGIQDPPKYMEDTTLVMFCDSCSKDNPEDRLWDAGKQRNALSYPKIHLDPDDEWTVVEEDGFTDIHVHDKNDKEAIEEARDSMR
jgi:hypothetical protein